MIRHPAVAGRFYPADPAELKQTLGRFISPVAKKSEAIGLIAPHAGYIYSGAIAGAVYSRIAVPSRCIVLCPNHTGRGVPLSIMKEGAWRTPLGEIQIDQNLTEALMGADSDLENDFEAHRYEHALEVQLPFMASVSESLLRFAPITVGTTNLDALQALGRAMAKVVQEIAPGALIVASSDMNHYESDAVTRIKDRKAIEHILALDPEGLHAVVEREGISMCGYGPAVSMLTAAKLLGASRAELVAYGTSADVSQDFDYVVGYAGVIVDRMEPAG